MVALWVEGDEGVALVEVEVFQDCVHAKFGAPLHAGSVHLLGALDVMLPCSQKSPQEVVVCMSKIATFDWKPFCWLQALQLLHVATYKRGDVCDSNSGFRVQQATHAKNELAVSQYFIIEAASGWSMLVLWSYAGNGLGVGRCTCVGVKNPSLLQLFLEMLHKILLQQHVLGQYGCICQCLSGGFDPSFDSKISKGETSLREVLSSPAIKE